MIKHRDLIDKMTLEEKASLLSGENFWNTKSIERLGIPSIMLTDGPHGLRKQGGKADHLGLNKSIPATCFPTAATLANSWDSKLLEQVGKHLALECKHESVDVILGPGLNIKRNPLCGRNFEYFSEDPYLTGKLAASMVRGIENQGVSACPKHYAVNSQEHMRMSIDERVDDRALRELYLEGFRYAITEGRPSTLMTSYNKVNGIYANEHPLLLQKVLFEEWRFQGVVVTDWGGNNDRLKGLVAGNHLEMPSTGGITDHEIVVAIKEKRLDEALLDERVDTLLTLLLKKKNTLVDQHTAHLEHPLDFEAQHRFSVECAKQSMVLLKNLDNALPLKTEEKIAVIGPFAKKPRYQGAGSSLIEPQKLDDGLSHIRKRTVNFIGYAEGFNRLGGKNDKKLKDALALASLANTVIVFLGLDEGSEAEGVDRSDLSLRSEQLNLMQELSKLQTEFSFKTIVVLSGGSPIELPFEETVQGILHSYLGGQGSGEATASLLFGESNPSGKLAETYPMTYLDVPSSNYYPGLEKTSEHRESIYFGYRYYEKNHLKVKYPFGYGLSYTTFEYSDFDISDDTVTLKVTNTGTVAGSEIVQLYIGKKQELIFRCKKELKGFTKVFLNPGESRWVNIKLEQHSFEFFDIFTQLWQTEPGSYEISIGASSEDIRWKNEIEIHENSYPFKSSPLSIIERHSELFEDKVLAPYYTGEVQSITTDVFEKLCRVTLPKSNWTRSNPLMMNDTIRQAKYKSWIGRGLYHLLNLTRKLLWLLGRPVVSNNVYFIMNMPYRQIERFTKGKVSRRTVLKMIDVINDGVIKGLFKSKVKN